MLGLGEKEEEVIETLYDLKNAKVDVVTLGQYLQPSTSHVPVSRYVTPEEFQELGKYAEKLGFISIASSPLVRSSYHAEMQASLT